MHAGTSTTLPATLIQSMLRPSRTLHSARAARRRSPGSSASDPSAGISDVNRVAIPRVTSIIQTSTFPFSVFSLTTRVPSGESSAVYQSPIGPRTPASLPDRSNHIRQESFPTLVPNATVPLSARDYQAGKRGGHMLCLWERVAAQFQLSRIKPLSQQYPLPKEEQIPRIGVDSLRVRRQNPLRFQTVI